MIKRQSPKRPHPLRHFQALRWQGALPVGAGGSQASGEHDADCGQWAGKRCTYAAQIRVKWRARAARN
jgi:hypothetical protein